MILSDFNDINNSLQILFIKFYRKLFIHNHILNIFILPKHNFLSLYFLKHISTLLFTVCLDIIVYDNPGKQLRFTLIYTLISYKFNYRLNLYLQLNEMIPIITISTLFYNLK